MARSGAATYAQARAKSSRTARQGGCPVGIAYEASRNRLWVAGGGPGFFGAGDVPVYDASSGELLRTFVIPASPTPGARFPNDVAVTRDAVYITDSFNPQLVVIPLPADGSLPGINDATLLPVSGVAQTGGPNVNGIVAKSGVLIIAQSSTGSSSVSTQPPGRPS